jgi:hypothetical protein
MAGAPKSPIRAFFGRRPVTSNILIALGQRRHANDAGFRAILHRVPADCIGIERCRRIIKRTNFNLQFSDRKAQRIGNDETNRELESAGGWNRRDLHQRRGDQSRA